MTAKPPLTPDEHIARAKQELARGNPDYAEAHALVALAEAVIGWLQTPDAVDEAEPAALVTWQGDRQ